MISLWVATAYLLRKGKTRYGSLITALPAAFMSAVSLTYILTAKEGLQLDQTLSCILGATAAAVLLAIYAVILFCRLRKPEYRYYTKES